MTMMTMMKSSETAQRQTVWKQQSVAKISQILISNHCNSISKLNNDYNEYT